MDVIFAIMTINLIGTHAERMESGVSISPKFHSLDGSDAFHFPVAICTAMNIGPSNIDVVKVDEISSAQVSLELY